jgi:hypothetical protein
MRRRNGPMSRVDERIRDEVRRLERPVDPRGVMERVSARKARRRTTRRVQFAALALAVLSGTALGGYGLTRLIRPVGEPISAGSPDASVPAPGYTSGPPRTPAETCARNRLDVDMNADGRMDQVHGWSMAPNCDAPELGDEYWVHVDISTGRLTGYGYTDQVLDCAEPLDCRVLAAPDIDGDGSLELAIRLASGSTKRVGLYRFDEEAKGEREPALFHLEIAPPGDLWHEEFGQQPGPATFPDGDAGEHVHHLGCRTDSGQPLLDVVTWLHDAGSDEWRMHRASFELLGTELVLWDTDDERFDYLGGLPPGTDPCITEVV